MEIIERNLTVTLALNADVKTAILSLHDVLFNKIFRAQMGLFLSERYNSFRRVLQPLYEATWLQSRTGSRGVPPWLKGIVTICVVTKPRVLFDFGFGIRNQRETRWERSWTICCFHISSLLLGR